MRKFLIIGLLVVSMLTLPLIAACGGEEETETTAAPTQTTAAPTQTTAAPTQTTAAPTQTTAAPTETTAVAPAETLKVGVVVWTGWPIGFDLKRGMEVMIALDNEAGGIDVGGKKYKIEPVFLDSNNDQNVTMAAVNKLIYEEKVKYIINDTQYPGAFFTETEKNSVLNLTCCPIPVMFDPAYKYTFQTGTMVQITPTVAGWMAKNNPDIKSLDLAMPDEPGGLAFGGGVKAALEAYGVKVNAIVYPVTSSDFSAIGTQVRTDNPSAFAAVGNSAMDALIYQAVVQAGFKGRLINTVTVTAETLKTAVPVEGLEGYVGPAWPTEFDEPATEVAKAFKDKWGEVQGKWDGPEIQVTACYAAFRAALQKAGSLDVDALAEALANGLTFEGPTGKGEMIPRNDLGIARTVDNISEFCIKKIVGGVPTLQAYVQLDEVKTYLLPGTIGN